MWVRKESKFRLKASRENMTCAMEVVVVKNYPQYALVQFFLEKGDAGRYTHYSAQINHALLK